jgi:hypothetical protein
MAVIFKRLNHQTGEYENTGVVIDREFHGDEASPIRGLNLDFEGVEEELVETYGGTRYTAVKVDDDEVDISDFE